MPDKSKNPFVVEVEAPEVKVDPVVKIVTKPEVVIPVQPKKVIEKPHFAEAMRGESESERTHIQWGMFFAGVFVTLVVVGVSGGLWWAQKSNVGLKQVEATPVPTPVIAAASPTPTPVVWARETIKVDVLNASGVKGEATKIQSQIQALGYQKGTTGNAEIQTGSTISFSEDTATLSAVIKEDLNSIVEEMKVDDEVLKGVGVVRVVIGK